MPDEVGKPLQDAIRDLENHHIKAGQIVANELVPIADPSQKNMMIAQRPPTGILVSGHIILTEGRSRPC